MGEPDFQVVGRRNNFDIENVSLNNECVVLRGHVHTFSLIPSIIFLMNGFQIFPCVCF